MRFENKVVLITGGGSGIGAATAMRFAAEGACVAVVGRRSEKLAEVVGEIEAAGGVAMAVAGDVIVEEDVRNLFREIETRFGGVDVVVNSAGGVDRTKVADSTVEEWDRVMAVNVRSIFLTAKYAIPHMQRQRSGSIVNVSSISGLAGQADAASYSAAKAAANNLTRAMAHDYGPDGIRVNAVLPGLVRTEMSATRVLEGLSWEEMEQQHWLAGFPLGRVGRPEDIAAGILFLASEDAAWITGTCLVIDGGYTAGI